MKSQSQTSTMYLKWLPTLPKKKIYQAFLKAKHTTHLIALPSIRISSQEADELLRMIEEAYSVLEIRSTKKV